MISQLEIDAILKGEHNNPFAILGMHEVKINGASCIAIRTFKPHALEIFVVDLEKDTSYKMECLNEEGFFECILETSQPFKYMFKIYYPHGNLIYEHDTYRFGTVLTDFDLHIFNEGNNIKAYEKFGAHPMQLDGVSGVFFAVWAPEAYRVSVVGDFNQWDGRRHVMRARIPSGVWELFIPHLKTNEKYRYEIKTKEGYNLIKSDPFSFYCEMRPKTASIIVNHDNYTWNDADWLEKRSQEEIKEKPVSIYEVHLGSYKKNLDNTWMNYREIAKDLARYVKEMGYTHIEIMPILEHPFDGSWGYQVTGYFAPTSRFGTIDDFKYFVDFMHQNNIGVILDWVPAHFPKDAHALARFDGTCLYEHLDPRRGEHKDWDTLIFNYGRNEVRSFLISSAIYWIEKFHIDGLRIDAVASMLYLDYSKQPGEWLPNKYGGNENLEAIEFIKQLNTSISELFPGVFTVAEESTAWPLVSRPVEIGGLGFTFKWNMGFMHDMLEYFKADPFFRKNMQNKLTFSLFYAFSENFILSFSHDEVVHLKKSMLHKMWPSDYYNPYTRKMELADVWKSFAHLRALYVLMYGHPGKKLLFMGQDFAQHEEWNHAYGLHFHELYSDCGYLNCNKFYHAGISKLIKDLNTIYKENPPLYEVDFHYSGFKWIDFTDSARSVISFLRIDKKKENFIVFVFNFTPMVWQTYRVGVPKPGIYNEILNSDSYLYGGSNVGNSGGVLAQPIPVHDQPYSIVITLPPLSGLIFKLKKQE